MNKKGDEVFYMIGLIFIFFVPIIGMIEYITPDIADRGVIKQKRNDIIKKCANHGLEFYEEKDAKLMFYCIDENKKMIAPNTLKKKEFGND